MAIVSKVLVIGGSGYIGKYIVEASVKNGHQTYALLREQTFSQPHIQDYFLRLGVHLIHGDIYDHESLVKAMKKVDVVISAVGHRSHSNILIQDQIKILAAIKEAGNIKRFIPSEYGMDVSRARVNAIGPAKSLFEAKMVIRQAIEKERIPFTIVCSNYFARICIPYLFQYDIQSSTMDHAIIFGDGTSKAIFSMEEDIATYTMKTINDPRTINKIVHIRPDGNIYSSNQLLSLWENKIGNTVSCKYITEEQLLKDIQDESDALNKLILAVAYSSFVKGDQTNFDLEPSIDVEATKLYPEVKHTTVDEYLDHLAATSSCNTN
ncbi:phenylcoumaran benzylic ether reductase Betv6-like isoform X1 [Amaranthus tricolor]|uniref:phenylcoumaran benzylic ether reductase Betv6-like isoform X1 n=1 Tax=Amaranthus tricolor TaxID=29722 RepID=UPI0025852B22|nr:phenylcoumaran benzylic ether reductase Betv6-like isoform X1 [Amaranthus tricolor]